MDFEKTQPQILSTMNELNHIESDAHSPCITLWRELMKDVGLKQKGIGGLAIQTRFDTKAERQRQLGFYSPQLSLKSNAKPSVKPPKLDV
jgi:hypothetical protein